MHDKAQNIELVLYGVKQEIDAILSPNEQARKNIEIIPAENSIAADFHPE